MDLILRMARIAAASAALAVAGPAFANDIEDCNQVQDAERRIAGCTTFIARGVEGRYLAIGLTNRGVAHDLLSDSESAIADFTAAIEADPTYAAPYYNRGVAYGELGQLLKAILDLDEAIRLDPTDPDAYDSRGFTKTDLRQFEEAVEDFTRAIELDPNFGAAYYHRGIALHALADLESATADYERALELGCLRQGWCPPRQ